MASRVSTRWLMLAGVVGPVTFVTVFLVEGAIRPGYDAARQFVSLLSLGDGGWLQVANFIVTGLLIAGFGLGLRRRWAGIRRGRWAPRLLILVGFALIGAGLFAPDPALGYPAGAPAGLPTSVSWHGGVHYLAALGVFLGLPITMAIATQHAPSANARTWAVYSLASGAVMLLGWLATFTVTGPDGTLMVAGLLQRIAVVAGFQWLVATAVIELRRPASAPVLAFA